MSPLAGELAIKRAYQNLARKYHPDKNPSDKKAGRIFTDINEAYEVLKDPFKRKAFDRELQKQKEAQKKQGRPHQPMYSSFHTYQSFSPSSPPQKDFKNPRLIPFKISLEEAAAGCKKSFMVLKKHKAFVHIPPGVLSGQKLKIHFLNSPALNDWYMEVSYKKHTLFEKQGGDICMELPVPFTIAVLGGVVEVPTLLNGRLKLTLPPLTRAGHVLEIKNQGFPLPAAPKKKGSMRVKILVDLPYEFSKEDKAWIQQWKKRKAIYPKWVEFQAKRDYLLKNRSS